MEGFMHMFMFDESPHDKKLGQFDGLSSCDDGIVWCALFALYGKCYVWSKLGRFYDKGVNSKKL